MNILRIARLALLLLLPTCFAAAHAEALDAAAWKFSVVFPCQSQLGSQVVKTNVGDVVMTSYACGDDAQASMVAINDYPAGSITNEDSSYAGVINGAATAIKYTIRSTSNYTLGSITGREAFLDSADGKTVARLRVFLVGTRLYQVMYIGITGSEKGNVCLDFLNSFALTGTQ